MSIIVGSPEAMSDAVLGPSDLPTQQAWNPQRFADEQSSRRSASTLHGKDGMATLMLFAGLGGLAYVLERYSSKHRK